MIEFRLASFTVKSRRYVDFSSAGYYMPEGLDEALTQTYATHMEVLFADYQYLIEHDVPKEDARFVLPYCFCSNFYCTLNGRELLHVLHAMLFGRGSRFPELVLLGRQLLEQARAMAPRIFAAFEADKRRRPVRWISRIFPACRKGPGFAAWLPICRAACLHAGRCRMCCPHSAD